MKIYTKKGDRGETGLFGGERVSKDHLRIQTYGELDGLNATLGLALTDPLPADLSARLLRIQAEIFQLGAELATPRSRQVTTGLIEAAHIEALEKEIDSMEAALSPLKTFILPGGTRGASFLHMARTTCRRAERELTTLHRAEPCRAEVLEYVNRLSDYLFVASRYANAKAGIADVPWNP